MATAQGTSGAKGETRAGADQELSETLQRPMEIALCRGGEEPSLPHVHALPQPRRNVLCPSGPRDAASDVPGSFSSIHIVMAARFPPFPFVFLCFTAKRAPLGEPRINEGWK